MIRSIAAFVPFLFVAGPGIAMAQHSVGPRGIGGGAPQVGIGPRHGGGFGYYGGPGVRLGPLPYPNHSANPIWQLHPNLYPKVNIPGHGSLLPGNALNQYPYVRNSYYPGGFGSGYILPYGNFYGPTYSYIPYSTVVIPPPSDPFDYLPPPKRPAVTAADIAEIQVRVPAGAKVWFDGVESTLVGTQRDFATPPMPRGLFTTYEIRARWTEAGREIEQTRRLPVRAGGSYVVDFTVAEEAP